MVADRDPLAAAFDNAGGFPRACDPADRMQSRCCHLGDVLTAQRKIDQRAGRLFLARLIGQFEDCMGDAPLGVFRRDFPQSLVRLLQAAADHAHCIAGEHGVLAH